MPSPMSGRGKEFMGYKISDTDLLVGALVIFVAVRVHFVPRASLRRKLVD